MAGARRLAPYGRGRVLPALLDCDDVVVSNRQRRSRRTAERVIVTLGGYLLQLTSDGQTVFRSTPVPGTETLSSAGGRQNHDCGDVVGSPDSNHAADGWISCKIDGMWARRSFFANSVDTNDLPSVIAAISRTR